MNFQQFPVTAWNASYLAQFSGELLKVDQVWDVARSTAVNLSVVRAETG